MRSVWAAAFLLRRLRGEVGIVLLIVGLVAATSLVFSAAPRLLDRVSDAGLRHEVQASGPVQRNLQLSTVSVLPVAEGSLDAVNQLGDDLADEFPAVLRRAIGGRQLAFTTVRFEIPDPPNYDTFITLRHQSGLDDAIRMTDGRLPASTGDHLAQASFGLDPAEEPPPPVPPVFEIAVSDATAREIGVAVGDVLFGLADGADPLIGRAFQRAPEARFEVVGIYAVTDPDAEAWYADRALQLVNVGGTLDNPIAFATALVAPDTLDGLVTSEMPVRYQWRYLVDPSRLDAGQEEELTTGLERLETQFQTTSSDASLATGFVLRSGLLDIVERYHDQRAATTAVLSVAAIGPFALAIGAIGMIGILLVSRRRPSLELTRGRGATGWLLLGTQLWEGLLVAAPPALLGWGIATLIVPGRPSLASAVLGLLVCLAAALVLVLATWPAARRPYGTNDRDEAPPIGASPRRLVLEGTAVFLAVAGAMLLRQRGLAIADEEVRFDPFLAAVPVLAAVAVGIVLLRVYPFPIRAGGWFAARRRDLVPVLGLRNVGRHSGAVALPLLVLMLTAAFSAFASVVSVSVDRGQQDASWQAVGADYRIDTISGAGLSSRVDPDAIDGVQAWANALVDTAAPFEIQSNLRSNIFLNAPDLAAYGEVLDGSPAAVAYPAPMLDAPDPSAGTPDRPIPAIISRRLPGGGAPFNPGDTFLLTVRGQPMTMEVVQVRETFAGVPPETGFVIASFEQLAAAYQNPPLLPSTVLLRGPAEIEEEVASTFSQQSASVRFVSRHAAYRALLEAPLVAAIVDGFRLTMVVCALYTAIAVIAALTLSAARRRREEALLRTLGLSGGQSLWLTVVEHAPSVLLAVLPGLALGIAIAYLLAPGMGLSAFAGGGTLDLRIDWWVVGLVSLALAAVVALAIGIGTWTARRARAADALRFGDD
jgi:putative ABC transport system permease protein